MSGASVASAALAARGTARGADGAAAARRLALALDRPIGEGELYLLLLLEHREQAVRLRVSYVITQAFEAHDADADGRLKCAEYVAAARSLDARPRDDAFHTRCYEQALCDFVMLQLDFATFHLLAESLLDRDALLRMTSPPL